MNAHRHTSGPWERVDTADYAEIWPVGEHSGSAIALVGKEADADLIAAAPDMLAALKKAAQLADIATDWNLSEVEIDGQMVSVYDLKREFAATIAKASQP